MRELEKNNSKGSQIKVKKYETILVQIWQLLPQFCRSNSPNLRDCFIELIKYLEPIMNKDLLGMRSVALKTYSSLINHCRHTKVVDEEIKKTRKGLINISMDYVQGLATLYTQDDATFGSVQDTEEKVKFYRSAQQGQILKTLQDFASVAKAGKLNNLFL